MLLSTCLKLVFGGFPGRSWSRFLKTKLFEHIYQATPFLNFSLGSCDTFLLIPKGQKDKEIV